MFRRVIAVSLMFATSTVFADTIDVNLSNRSAQLKYAVPSGVAGKSELFAGFMYNDQSSQFAEAGLLVMNEEGSVPGLSIGVNAKAVGASLSKISLNRKVVSGVALGAQVRFEVPSDRRFAFVAEYHYAPKIISFGDADHFYQGALRAEYAMSPLTQIYVGARTTQFVMINNQPNGVIDEGAHIGVRLSF
ncbi:MAG: hypothetical protein HOO97_08575 [Sideroxydans sp.]|nr:hypothetical protein [Sideroxydans sp.]NOT99131.1 hypothetical protein [Sideroxydans sp.]